MYLTSEGKVEVREFPFDFCEIFEIERLDEGTCSIEEADGLFGLEGLEKVHDMAPERCHSGATTNEDLFLGIRIIGREEELSVRAADHDLVTRLAGENIG